MSVTIASPPDQISVLDRILREANTYRRKGQPFLTVFDLDSTLFDLTLRVAAIIDQFTNEPEYRSLFPDECEKLKNVQLQRTDWGLGEPLERIGISSTTHPHLVQELHQYWATCFFSNDYLHLDAPLPGAVEYVEELRNQGAHIMYLTGRDIPRMQSGTEVSLRATGFPLGGPEARLVLKPTPHLNDAEFKVEILKEAERDYERIWLFENEPVNLNLTAKQCPRIGLVFIDSTHSGREQVAETLDKIAHFEVDLEGFRKTHRALGK